MQNKEVDITAYKAIDHLNELAWSMNREDSHESIELANKALEDSEKCEYVFGIACAKKTLSACYVWNSRNDESANLCFQAIALFQNLKDKQNEADVNYILGSNFFYLSEYVNIALNRSATQVNTYYESNLNYAMAASYSVDGSLDTGSCTYGFSPVPWWSVDLGQPYNVIMINVTDDPNPTKCKYNSLHTLQTI